VTGTTQALGGIKVVELGGYAAGPHAGKVLANFGATVVHVESHKRPDGFRLEYPPFKDNIAGINRGGCFAFFNDSKYGVTLDLKKAEGLELARRLIDWADIVIENMRPGVVTRLGLGYEEMRETNPGLIMLSTCNMGQTGPRAHTPGFGTQLSSLAGFCGAIGDAEGPPMLLYGPYIDFIASLMACAAILAALDRKRHTGKGCWIDLSQYECGVQFMAGAMFGYHRDGTIAGRNANRDRVAAPHNAYQCENDRWLALSCHTDSEFAALTRVLGCPDLADDPRFSGVADRHENLRALDAAIGAKMVSRDAEATAVALQEAGVAAYPVNTVADLFADPQLNARRSWRPREHGEIGEQNYLMPGFDLSSTRGDVTRAAPLLGGDNRIVFEDLLGLDRQELDAYVTQGALH